MKTVSIRELRQNPSQMLRDVEAGESYMITSHNRPIARVEPTVSSTQIVPPKRRGRPKLSTLPKHEVRTAGSIDDLLDEMRGEW